MVKYCSNCGQLEFIPLHLLYHIAVVLCLCSGSVAKCLVCGINLHLEKSFMIVRGLNTFSVR